MRIRHATSALVALGAASACALGGSIVLQDETQREEHESALRSSAWSLQASTDFGTTWTAPVSSYGGHFPVPVDTSELRNRPAYHSLTLRTSVDSKTEAHVAVEVGTVIEGDPAVADEVRVRAVESREGTCAAPTFTSGSRNLLEGDLEAAQPVGAPTVDRPVQLPGATRTTAGPPMTLCFELSIESDAPVSDGQVTLGWPIDVTRAGSEADEA